MSGVWNVVIVTLENVLKVKSQNISPNVLFVMVCISCSKTSNTSLVMHWGALTDFPFKVNIQVNTSIIIVHPGKSSLFIMPGMINHDRQVQRRHTMAPWIRLSDAILVMAV